MAKIDKKYHSLLNTILKQGRWYEDPNRKGVKRLQIPHYSFEYDLKEGFPAISTKKLFWKGVVGELLWFLRGDTNIKYLVDNNINIWNKDYSTWKNKFNNIEEGYLGKIYGHQWRKWGSKNLKQPQPKPNFKYGNPLITPDLSNKKAIYCGKTFRSRRDGDFIVISYTKNKGYNIQFLENGGIRRNVLSSNIKTGSVRNPYKLSVKGIACIGKKKKVISEKHRRLIYQTWTNLLNRCYDKNHLSYDNYGGKGVYVEDRWLCFEYFLDDVSKFDNFSNKLDFPKDYQLDKDFIGDGFKYSKNTCQWLSSSENISGFKNEIYTLENIKTNKIVKTDNLHKFCYEHNLGLNGTKIIYYLKSKKLDIYKNWKLTNIMYKRNFAGIDQISNLIKNLKENPLSSSHIVTAWNPSDLDQMALPPCHFGFQIMVYKLSPLEIAKYSDKSKVPYEGPEYGFDLLWQQRSVDTFLGLPLNIASYALLAHIIGKIVSMVPGKIYGDLRNVHLYDNAIEGAKEQMARSTNNYPCDLKITKTEDFWQNFDVSLFSHLEISDFILENYNPMGTIKVEMLERDE